MSKKIVNLTRAVSVRLRHDQEDTINSIIESMTPEQLTALKDQDRSRFRHPELFKNRGRGSNPLMMLMRLALDDYLKKYQAEQLTEDDHDTYQERIKLEGMSSLNTAVLQIHYNAWQEIDVSFIIEELNAYYKQFPDLSLDYTDQHIESISVEVFDHVIVKTSDDREHRLEQIIPDLITEITSDPLRANGRKSY